jgi:hypothetical protein
VGEFIRYKGFDYKITKVTHPSGSQLYRKKDSPSKLPHNLDFDSHSSLATINPEAFIDVSLCDVQSP